MFQELRIAKLFFFLILASLNTIRESIHLLYFSHHTERIDVWLIRNELSCHWLLSTACLVHHDNLVILTDIINVALRNRFDGRLSRNIFVVVINYLLQDMVSRGLNDSAVVRKSHGLALRSDFNLWVLVWNRVWLANWNVLIFVLTTLLRSAAIARVLQIWNIRWHSDWMLHNTDAITFWLLNILLLSQPLFLMNDETLKSIVLFVAVRLVHTLVHTHNCFLQLLVLRHVFFYSIFLILVVCRQLLIRIL